MQHLEFHPPEELQDTIKCFWYDNRDFGETESGFTVLPDGYAEIIFHFGNGCRIANNELPSPFLMGLLNHPVTVYTKSRLEIIGIRCFPWSVFDFLGLPSAKKNVHTFQHPIAQLQEPLDQLVKAGKIDEAIERLKTYFDSTQTNTLTNNTLSKAGTAMSNAKGTLPVKQVAAAAHATVRTLERKFKESSGHTVKDVSAVMRFEQVRNRLWLHPDSGIAGLAHEFGYADQSHLSREFKRFSGATPAAFARKAKKAKQAVSSDFVAFVQA